MSSTKAAEPIEIPFGVWTAVGKRNHVSDRGPDTHNGRGNFEGVWAVEKHCKAQGFEDWAKR